MSLKPKIARKKEQFHLQYNLQFNLMLRGYSEKLGSNIAEGERDK